MSRMFASGTPWEAEISNPLAHTASNPACSPVDRSTRRGHRPPQEEVLLPQPGVEALFPIIILSS